MSQSGTTFIVSTMMENRIQIFEKITVVLNHELQRNSFISNMNTSQDDLFVDSFITTYMGTTNSVMQLSLPVLTSNIHLKENEQSITAFILRDVLKNRIKFSRQDQHILLTKQSSNNDDERDRNTINIDLTPSDNQNQEIGEIYKRITFMGGDTNVEKVKKELRDTIESLREGLKSTTQGRAKTLLRRLLTRTVKKSISSNKGLISWSAAYCMAGNYPKKIHTEESDHKIVEESLKEFEPSSLNQPQVASNNNQNVDHIAKIKKIEQPITFREQLSESMKSSPARHLNVSVGTCTASFSAVSDAGSASNNKNHFEKKLIFYGEVELLVLNKLLLIKFSTAAECHAEFADASTTVPKELCVSLDSKTLVESISESVSKQIREILLEEKKVRAKYLTKKIKNLARPAKKKNSAKKREKGIKRKIESISTKNVKQSDQEQIHDMPIQYPYSHNHTFYHFNQGLDQSGLDSLGNAAEAYRMAEEAKIRSDSFGGGRSSFVYQGGLPNYGTEFGPTRQNFNRFSSGYLDPNSYDQPNFLRYPYTPNEQYDYFEPRRASRMARRQSNDSMVAAIEAVCMAELEAERRQRSSFHEAMSLLDASTKRPSLTSTMATAAADTTRFADIDVLRRSSFLSTGSVDNFDPFVRSRINQYSFDESFPNMNIRRQSSGPESVLAAAEIVRLAELKQSNNGQSESMPATADLVHISEQMSPNRYVGNNYNSYGGNSFVGMGMNDYTGNQFNMPAGIAYPSTNDRNFLQYNQPYDATQFSMSHSSRRSSFALEPTYKPRYQSHGV